MSARGSDTPYDDKIIIQAIARQDAARTRRLLQASGVRTKCIWFDLTGQTKRSVTWTRIEYRICRDVRDEMSRQWQTEPPAKLAA